jgi:hypothetical protein
VPELRRAADRSKRGQHRNHEEGKPQTKQTADQSDEDGFAENEQEHGKVREADGFEDGELAGALATEMAMVLPVTRSRVKEYDRADR